MTRSMLRYSAILVCILLMQGCLVIPVPGEEEPFTREVGSNVILGETSREDIRELFGDPDHSYGEGRWWLFQGNRRTTEWYLIIGHHAGASAGSFGGQLDRYLLAIEFSGDNTVVAANVFPTEHGCDPGDSVCAGDLSISVDRPLRFDTSSRADSCQVFVYWSAEGEPRRGTLRVDDRVHKRYRYSPNDFVMLQLPAGPHELSVGLWGSGELRAERAFLDCVAGEETHLRVQYADLVPQLTVLNPEPGAWETALASRRQAILRDRDVPRTGEEVALEDLLPVCGPAEVDFTMAVQTIPETPILTDTVTLVLRSGPTASYLHFESVLVSVPEHSRAWLRNSRSRMPEFDADQPGEYRIRISAQEPTDEATCRVEADTTIVIGEID